VGIVSAVRTLDFQSPLGLWTLPKEEFRGFSGQIQGVRIKYVEYMADLSNPTQATLKSNSRGLASLVVIKSAVLPQVRARASAHKEAKSRRA